jgi:hypothetical protein
MNTSQLLNQVLRQGGATIKPSNLTSYTGAGYGIAISKVYERIIPLSGDAKELQGRFNEALSELRFIAASHGYYIGAWIDGGRLYLDVTEIVHSLNKAMFLGFGRNQLAIWDFKAKQAIELNRKVG